MKMNKKKIMKMEIKNNKIVEFLNKVINLTKMKNKINQEIHL